VRGIWHEVSPREFLIVDRRRVMSAEIDFTDPKWRFEERVANLVNKGRTQQEAEEIVKTVITTKEIE
jgi:hypothetical protein